MTFKNRILTLSALFLLLVSTFAVMSRPHTVAQPLGEATLTGTIFDHGVDTDGNGLYDYLEIDVQINVTVSGEFTVTASGLLDQSYSYISVFNTTKGFLDIGIQFLNVSLPSPAIFGSGLNPEMVSSITLFTDDYLYLDNIYSVALSRVYNYTEFGPSAFLTGRVSDRGIDTDGDVLFNYLEVGIEFNVTEAGEYEVGVSGLMEKSANRTLTMYDYHSETEDFAVGIHTFYMNFSGSQIVSNGISPTHVGYTSIYDVPDGFQTSSLDSAPLSMQYDSTLFNAPSKDVQVNFKVYPNATVAVDGALNFTHMDPENTNMPQMNATVGFSTIGNLTTETSSGTFVFPDSPDFNFSATEGHARTSYANGLLNASVNGSTILPQEAAGVYPFNTTDMSLTAQYAGGLVDVAITGTTVVPSYETLFPFNMSDVTVLADYDGTQLVGNITFHAIGGFPLADVRVDFSGNRSNLVFTGNVNVTFVDFGGLHLNETIVDQMLTDLKGNITGQGPSSLYNLTGGYLECTQLDTTKIPWSNATLGADYQYAAYINGSLTGAITLMMFPPGSPSDFLHDFAQACLESAVSSVRKASLTLNYYHSSGIAQVDLHLTSDVQALWNSLILSASPVIPTPWSSMKPEIEGLFKIANATAYALTDASFNASYSSAQRKISLSASLSAKADQLKNDIFPVLPDMVAPSMHDLFESLFNTTYCNTLSATSGFDMVNGAGTFSSAVTVQGDFEAELNREKLFIIAVLSQSYATPMPWELRLLNETEININNFQAKFGLGKDWMHASFSGLVLKPQPDDVDLIRFMFQSWLNLTTAPDAPPQNFEKLTVTVTGGSSADRTILLDQPSDVPTPDDTAGDYRSMAWNNVSLSSLKDLLFLIAYEEHIDYNARTYDVLIFTNSTLTTFDFNAGGKQIAFNVTGSAGTGFCNVTIPKNLLNATLLSDWVVKLDGTPLSSNEFSITENAEYVFVYLNYTHSEHEISIVGTWLVAEFQLNILPIVLAIFGVIAAMVVTKHRRKLQPFEAKCRQTLSRLSSRVRS